MENKTLKKVLKKMCKIVGANYNDIDFEKEDWYFDYSWSEKQERMFEKWLARKLYWKYYPYLYNHLYVPTFWQKLKGDKFFRSRCKAAARWFSLNYGWRSL